MEINIQFANPQQREVYYATARKQCFSGGFNNGKSFIFCLKLIVLLLTFRNYRVAICRQVYKDLKKTTMQTFFKMLPTEMVLSHNEQDGVTVLKNGSTIYWLHLDNVDENTLRGLEINAVFVDQAEEIEEKVYTVLLARIGRWDGAIVPDHLIRDNWPRNKFGKPEVPSYMFLACNPETQFHFIYRIYHPDSDERDPSVFYIEGEWDPNLGSKEAYDEAVAKDPEWVDKYVKGKWGISSSAIHTVSKDSYLVYTPELINSIITEGNLFRVLDHGESAPTCCLWVASIWGVYIFYREYYVPNRVISYHRQAIADLSGKEEYSANYADPAIFKKSHEKDGGFWTVAMEYGDTSFNVPPLYWIPADNNEFATRNRINELLLSKPYFRHPITKTTNSPGIYFIKASSNYPYGCRQSIRELSLQRKKLIATINGKPIYADDREDSVSDHAYDCIRYFVAMHGSQPNQEKPKIKRNTFAYFNKVLRKTNPNLKAVPSC